MKSKKLYWSKLTTFLCVSVALAAFPVLANTTCIVSTPAGDRNPHHSQSSAIVAVDAGAGASTMLQSWLEARFATFYVSPGIALTTMPLGFMLSVK